VHSSTAVCGTGSWYKRMLGRCLAFLLTLQVEDLGITVVSGDQWLDEEVAHALRLLEIAGRTDIPVVGQFALWGGQSWRQATF
jgi:hypothetical protein